MHGNGNPHKITSMYDSAHAKEHKSDITALSPADALDLPPIDEADAPATQAVRTPGPGGTAQRTRRPQHRGHDASHVAAAGRRIASPSRVRGDAS